MKILRRGPGVNCLHFEGVHVDLSFTNDELKIDDGSLFKDAFFQLEVQIILSHLCKDLVDNLSMKGEVMGSSDKDVIKIDKDESGGNQIFENFIDELLECGWGIA